MEVTQTKESLFVWVAARDREFFAFLCQGLDRLVAPVMSVGFCLFELSFDIYHKLVDTSHTLTLYLISLPQGSPPPREHLIVAVLLSLPILHGKRESILVDCDWEDCCQLFLKPHSFPLTHNVRCSFFYPLSVLLALWMGSCGCVLVPKCRLVYYPAHAMQVVYETNVST